MKQELDLKPQVKQILALIQKVAPGKSVELRKPPYAAIQCVQGSTHRRGTPANMVEMAPEILINLVSNPKKWVQFFESGDITASGNKSDIGEIFILVNQPIQLKE